MKRIIGLVSFIILVFAIAGCAKQEEKKEEILYYKEDNIPLPEQIGIVFDMKILDGKVNILTDVQTDGHIFEYGGKDTWTQEGEWASLSDSVMFEGKFLDNDTAYTSVLYNALLVKSEEEAENLEPHYYVIENENSKELSLNLSQGNTYEEDNLFHCMYQDKEGFIGVDNAGIIYSFSHDGAQKYVIEEPRKQQAGVAGMIKVKNTIYAVLDNGEVLSVESDSGETTEGDKKIIDFLKLKKGSYTIYANKNQIYKINNHRLYSYNIEKEKTKTLLDFQYYDLKNGVDFQILPNKEKGFYIAYSDKNGKFYLNSYQYVKEGIKPEKRELTIYSLTENEMLQSFVDMYNGKNPDVPVKIEYGYTSEDGKTREDALKLFHTELLTGNGADILVLDGMPVMSYGREGLLTDLNEAMDLSAITPDLFSNMLEPYQEGDAQYAVPCGFYLYGILGEEKYVETFHDTEAFLEIVEKNSKSFAFHDWNRSEAANIFYLQNAEKCFGQDKVERTEVSNLYENLKRMYSLSGNSWDEDNAEEGILDTWDTSSMDYSVEWIYNDNLPFVLSPYAGTDGIMAANYLQHEKDYYTDYVKQNGETVYHDQMIMAVPSSGNQTEEAVQFIEYILKEALLTVKKAGVETMLPVNKKAFEKELTENEDVYTIEEFSWDENAGEEDMIEVKGKSLDEKEIAELESRISNAVKAQYTEKEIRETTILGANEYLLGDKALDQAVEDVAKKIELYQKE